MQEARYSGQPEWVGCGSQNQTGASEENLPLPLAGERVLNANLIAGPRR